MTHAELVGVAARWLRRNRCGVVLTEHHGGTCEIPDAIGWRSWHSMLVECKVSLADFMADQKKPSRRSNDRLQAAECWYLAPAGLIDPEKVPEPWGLLEFDGGKVRRVKPAKLWPRSPEIWRSEVTRLFCELRRYQAQGIRYLTIAEQDRLKAQRQPEPRP